jgi:hypothetical protein
MIVGHQILDTLNKSKISTCTSGDSAGRGSAAVVLEFDLAPDAFVASFAPFAPPEANLFLTTQKEMARRRRKTKTARQMTGMRMTLEEEEVEEEGVSEEEGGEEAEWGDEGLEDSEMGMRNCSGPYINIGLWSNLNDLEMSHFYFNLS